MRNFGTDDFYNFHFTIAAPAVTGTAAGKSALSNTSKISRNNKNTSKAGNSSAADIQFMPESGPLVASLPTSVGFKAIGSDGKGITVKGIVYDKEGNAQAKMATLHNGMGIFNLLPQPGETYTAKITLSSGEVNTVQLPQVKNSGTLLKIKNNTNSDSLDVMVLATKDMQDAAHSYSVIGQLKGAVYYAANVKLTKDYLDIRVPKNLFPTGVAHFTLINAQNQPLNERLTFINHHDELKLDIQSNTRSFTPRDSIALHITVKDYKGMPAVGSFSLAVTDDTQINTAGYSNDIYSQLLLTAGLKGYIEDAGWYFSAVNEADNALDALLLTQGWVGYNWKNMLDETTHPTFAAEPEFVVKGKVTNLLNKPIANSNVILIGTGKYKLLKDTTTGNDGSFVFKNFPLTDSTTYVLQARKAKGGIIHAGITIDENTTLPAVVLPDYAEFNNNDSTASHYAVNSYKYQQELNTLRYGPGNHLLNTVVIKDKAAIKNSQNLNGAGNYDQAITRDEIEKAGKISLFQLIMSKVTGLHEGHIHNDPNLSFLLKEKRVRFVIDGIDLDRFYEPSNGILNEHYNYQRETLDYLTAADITGIEVIYSSKYNALYNNKNLTTDEQLAISSTGPAGSDVAYLEITTRSGNGPFTKPATGILVYKPAPVSIVPQFYRPKYPVKNAYPGFSDLRSTIHWEPNIITNKSGEATVSFYAADRPATYKLILQGTNLKGSVGSTTQTITIATK
jgi:hypothetical protein